HNSRNCWRTAGSLRPSQVARKALTAVNAQERASTMPRLHRAKTVACGLLKWGKCVWIIVVHSVTRGWQDIRILLGVMGVRQPPIPCPTEGCLVTSCMLLYRHFSKTYCRKRTLSSWLAEYRELTTYARLRSHALTLFTPHTLIPPPRLHHKQGARCCFNPSSNARLMSSFFHSMIACARSLSRYFAYSPFR